MRNLSRLTWAATADQGPREDRRRYPQCAQMGCRRRVDRLPDGTFTMFCWHHVSPKELDRVGTDDTR